MMRVFIAFGLLVLMLPGAAFAQTAPDQMAAAAPAGDAAAAQGSEASSDVADKINADGAPMPLPREIVQKDGSVGALDPLFKDSLLFSHDEISLIVDAATVSLKNAARNQRMAALRAKNGLPPIDTVIKKPDGAAPEPEVKAAPVYPTIPLNRQINLSGVFYRSPTDWVVWLNGRKVTPNDRPRELVGIKVERDRVHIKWFDIGMGKVISLTLRPRQTYDIVSGVLLPG